MMGADGMDEEMQDSETATEAALGGLSAYDDANVRKAMEARSTIAQERQKYYDDLAAKLSAQQTGPTFRERMFQLSAAFATPTAQRGLGGILANVAPVLQQQAQAKREGEAKRREALSALQAAQLAQREAAAGQNVTTEIALAKLGKQAPVRGVAVGDTLRNPFTNAPMGPEFNRVPKPEYYKALEQAPTAENLQAAVSYYPTFAVDLKAAYERGLRNKGR